MATLKITNLANAQQQIDAAKQGDVIDFTGTSGTISLLLRNGLNYVGGSARLISPAGTTVFHWTNLANVSISGFTLVGRGIAADATSGIVLDNSKITGNTFELGGTGQGIWLWVFPPAAMPPSNYAAWNAACATTMRNSHIDGNRFVGPANYQGQNEGLHIRFDTPAPSSGDFGPGKSADNTVSGNEFSNVTRSAIEIQGGGVRTIVAYNTFSQKVFSASQPVNSGMIVLSFAADASEDCQVHHNKIVGDGRVTDGKGFVNGIEAAGDRTKVFQNYIEGGNNGVNMQTPGTASINTNQIVNCLSNATTSVHITPPGEEVNNGPNVMLDWNPNGGSPTPTPTPTPTMHTLTLVGSQVAIDGTVDPGTSGVVSVDNAAQTQTNTKGDRYHLDGYGKPFGVWTIMPPVGPTPTPTPTPPPKTVMAVDTVLHYLDGTTKSSTMTP